jgi:hypothetical protein
LAPETKNARQSGQQGWKEIRQGTAGKAARKQKEEQIEMPEKAYCARICWTSRY